VRWQSQNLESDRVTREGITRLQAITGSMSDVHVRLCRRDFPRRAGANRVSQADHNALRDSKVDVVCSSRSCHVRGDDICLRLDQHGPQTPSPPSRRPSTHNHEFSAHLSIFSLLFLSSDQNTEPATTVTASSFASANEGTICSKVSVASSPRRVWFWRETSPGL
jgi:hypothetical protein